MKKRKNAAGCVGIALLAGFIIGCGDSKKDAPSPSTETASAGEEKPGQDFESAEHEMEHENPEGNSENQEDENNSPADNAKKETATLTGSIKSIGDNSLVVRQAFELEEDMLMQPAEGSSDEVLVSVNVSESTLYEVKTVKNSGVNGDADVESRQGIFSDLAENVTVDISGYYEGEIFMAEKICVMLFV